MTHQDNDKHVTVVRNATDLQRLKLEKLMKNPEKPAFIPDRPKDKRFSDPAEFVRNVMGSSAGAGSGEFHVYRHIRRREYARQEFLQNCKEKEDLDEEYHIRLENNRRAVEEKASKNRAKRQRKKERQKVKRQKKNVHEKTESFSSESSEEEEPKVPDEGNKIKTPTTTCHKEADRTF
uniref:PRKR-interacting protein 1 homolog n=2 Tax=Scylla olivacea TaxID=85551 RepID=A0A0P4W5F1_SCYOL